MYRVYRVCFSFQDKAHISCIVSSYQNQSLKSQFEGHDKASILTWTAATRCYRKAPDSLSAVSCVPVVAGFAIASFCIHTAYSRMSANILYTFIVTTESPCVPACILCLDKFLQPHHWTWFIVLICADQLAGFQCCKKNGFMMIYE